MKLVSITQLLLIFLGFLLSIPIGLAQKPEMKFEYLTMEDGLSYNTILTIFRDSKGYLWAGADYGLNKFDGYKIVSYLPNQKKKNAISNAGINVIYEDKLKNIWIGTYDGLNLYNPNYESFTIFKKDSIHNSISSSSVSSIIEDRNGNLWIGTSDGINRFCPETNNFFRYYIKSDSDDPSSNQISSMAMNSKGQIYVIGYGRYLYSFDSGTGTFSRFYNPVNESNDPCVKHIFIDDNDQIWITTEANGFYFYNTATEKFDQVKTGKSLKVSTSYGNIIQISRDELLVATNHGGILCYNKQNKSAEFIVPNEKEENNLNHDGVICLYKDVEGIIWVGTSEGGINYFNPKNNKFKLFQKNTNNPGSLCFNIIKCLYEDYLGQIWIGTEGGGVSIYNPQTKEFKNYSHNPSDPNSLSANTILGISEDKEHNMWIGTWYEGLNKLDRKTGKFYHFLPNDSDTTNITSRIISYLKTDYNGKLWYISYPLGIDVFMPGKGVVQKFRSDSSDPKSLLSYINGCFFEDNQKNMWIGNWAYGIYRYNSQTNSFISYKKDLPNGPYLFCEDGQEKLWCGSSEGFGILDQNGTITRIYTTFDGLPDNTINGMLTDNQGNIWLSTNLGLSKFNLESRTFRNYDKYDGLQGNHFKYGAFLKTRKGEMYFGGLNGLNSFSPDSLKDNRYIPEVVLSDFQIFNKSVPFGEKGSPLKETISQTKEITLNHKQTMFSIGFAAISLTRPEKNQYAYKIEGIDKDWIYTDAAHRFATYNRLDPGVYVFQVKASNNDGLWNETGTSLTIHILPAWWQTKLAKFLAILLFSLAIVSIYLRRINSLKRSKALLEEKIRTRTLSLNEAKEKLEIQNISLAEQKVHNENMAAELHEADQLKLNFFANISHEFRTPLTLIMASLEKFLPEPNSKYSPYFSVMYRNAKRLHKLVNLLLDVKRIDEKAYDLSISKTEIKWFVSEIVTGFFELSGKHQINLSLNSNIDHMECWFDTDVIEKVLFNLLSNAIKFTPEGGRIEVKLEGVNFLHHESSGQKNDFDSVKIIVADDGIGIAGDKLDKIFDRFYQVKGKTAKSYDGSGIGLALAKELIELHKGSLSVESIVDKGSCFTVSFPVIKSAFDEADILMDRNEYKMSSFITSDHEEIFSEPFNLPNDKNPQSQNNQPLILIVEDNADLRNLLVTELGFEFRVLEAENGKIGFNMAVKHRPDLILSDVVMPVMNGIELCNLIKTAQKTSHIPLILLSARSSEVNQIEGLNTGADDYIPKPFSINLLKVKIRNLIKNRDRIKELFKNYPAEDSISNELNEADRKFLRNLNDIVFKNIDNPSLSADLISREIGMSRTILYSKLKSLTDLSVNIFIRNVRVKQAAVLLQEKNYSIVEISEMVGFSSDSYFIRCFKDVYLISPSRYAK